MTAETVTKSSKNRQNNEFSIGNARINRQQRSVTVDDVSTTLTDLSWRFLMTLVEQSPAPASIDTLCERVWQSSVVSPETIAQRVRQVRQALKDDPRSPRFIRTIRGGGYQLIPEVLDAGQTPPESKERRAGKAVAAVALVLGLTVAGVALRHEPAPDGTEPAATETPTTGNTAPLESAAELVRRADEYRTRGLFQSNEIAIDIYQRALEREPDYHPALLGLSFALAHKTSKFDYARQFADRAAVLADRALLLNPDSGAAWAARGLADDARGRVTSALAYYERAAAMQPDRPQLISGMAYLKQVQGQLHAALLLESTALNRGPPSFFADFQIASALRLAGVPEAAGYWFDRAATLRPDNVFLLADQARELIIQGEFENALQLLATAAVSLNDQAFLRGLALRAAGQPEAALRSLKSDQQRARDRGLLCLSCTALLLQAGDPNAAASAADVKRREAENIAGGSQWPYSEIELAMLATAEGKPGDALSHLKQAVELGYRDLRWLKALQRLAVLPDTPAISQLWGHIDELLRQERALIIADPALQALLKVN